MLVDAELEVNLPRTVVPSLNFKAQIAHIFFIEQSIEVLDKYVSFVFLLLNPVYLPPGLPLTEH